MQEKLHYKDVVLNNPKYSDVESRDNLNIEVKLGERTFYSPAISANMRTAISFELAEQLAENGYFYILHRFYEYDQILDWLAKKNYQFYKSISVGVKGKDYQLINDIARLGLKVEYITVDIAHGHSLSMKNMINHICKQLGNKVFIIAGNACTPEACQDFYKWGADCVKIGLSCGKSCQTYNATGVGSPMFSTVLKCAESSYIPIIADGGIREVGDVCKALVAGATMVMIGSEFVKCIDSPAEGLFDDKIVNGVYHSGKLTHKKYYGSASSKNKGNDRYVEGWDEVILPCNGIKYLDYYQKIHDGVVSCMSYHNLRDVSHMNTIEWSKHIV